MSVIDELEALGVIGSSKPKPEPVAKAVAVEPEPDDLEIDDEMIEDARLATEDEAEPEIAPPPVAKRELAPAPRGTPPALIALKTLKAKLQTARVALADLAEAAEDMETMLKRAGVDEE